MPEKLSLIVINVVGGIAVLGSYAIWLSNPAHEGNALWGSISGAGRTLYTVSMLAAAAGYFAFAPKILVAEIEQSDLLAFNTLFALILFPSALWMPLAFEYLDTRSASVWWAMRFTLAVVGVASLLLVVALLRLPPGTGRALAVLGAAAFTFQTLVLDAIVWPIFMKR
jgi:hypothetical protein